MWVTSHPHPSPHPSQVGRPALRPEGPPFKDGLLGASRELNDLQERPRACPSLQSSVPWAGRSSTCFEQPKCQARHLWVTSSSQRLCALPCLHSPVPSPQSRFPSGPFWALYPLPLCPLANLALGARQDRHNSKNTSGSLSFSLSLSRSPMNCERLCSL